MAAATLVTGFALTSGCTVQYVDYTAFARTPDVVLAHARYRIAPPDQLRVRSRLVREVDGILVTVRPDGTMMLPLLGKIQAADRTRFELAAALTRRAREYYADPHVDVRVEHYASQHVFVHGCVAQPGAQPYDARNTVLTALARAEPTAAGDPTRIFVLKPRDNGRYEQRVVVNLDAITDAGRRMQDVILNPGEIVHVPRHPLATQNAEADRAPSLNASHIATATAARPASNGQ